MKNNSDLVAAQSNYDSALLSLKTMDGSFAPGLSFSSSVALSKNYDWNTNPDYFSTYITYTQPLPGGTSFSATGKYSFNSTALGEERYVSQIPDVSFTLSQSLRPFWSQGAIQDPTILNAKQQAEYYRLQVQHKKKSVLQNLIQNYAYALIYKNQIKIYRNSIYLIDEQIQAAMELKFSGITNQAKITELKNTKWSYEEDLMSAHSSYQSYLQNLKVISNCEIDDIEINIEEFITSNELNPDPMDSMYQLKLQMLKNDKVLQKQNSAPSLNFTLQPAWTLETVKNSEWKDAWNNGEKPSWNASVSVNFSPFLNTLVSKQKNLMKIIFFKKNMFMNNIKRYSKNILYSTIP